MDKETSDLLSSGNTLGAFQLESPGMRALLKKVKPVDTADVAAVIALYRPGPMGNRSHEEYAARRGSGRGPELHPELDDILQPILEETSGVVVYQEQVLKIISAVTGWTTRESTDIFDAMRKKNHEKLAAAKPSFFKAASGYSQSALDVLWDMIVPFSDYSFPKAHAVGYAHITEETAALKAHHPLEFMTVLLRKAEDTARVASLIYECRQTGIPILPPDINSSGLTFSIRKTEIVYGLSSIKGVGEEPVSALIRGRPYGSIDDFLLRVDPKVLNARVVDAFARSGVFDSLYPDREGLVSLLPECVKRMAGMRKDISMGRMPLRIPPVQGSDVGYDYKLRQSWERELIGVPVSYDRPITKITQPLSEAGWTWVRATLKNGARLEYRGINVSW